MVEELIELELSKLKLTFEERAWVLDQLLDKAREYTGYCPDSFITISLKEILSEMRTEKRVYQ